MSQSWLFKAIWLVVLLFAAHLRILEAQRTQCVEDESLCGANSNCTNGECTCLQNFASLTGSNADCIDDTVPNPNCTTANCVYCNPALNCIRCVAERSLMNTSTQSCVNDCPNGVRIAVVEGVTSTVCISGSEDDSGNVTLLIGIIIGVSIIVVIILLVLLIYCVYAVWIVKKQRIFEIERSNEDDGSSQNRAFIDHEHRDDTGIDDETNDEENAEDDAFFNAFADGDDDYSEFMRKLAKLRKKSAIFLRMLNDMRRRLKDLHPDAQAAKSYRNVMQDVTRLLYLLNKKPQNVQMPVDGLQLLKWSEDILERFLQSQQQKQRNSKSRMSAYESQAETHF